MKRTFGSTKLTPLPFYHSVQTGNLTQLGIAFTEYIRALRARSRATPDAAASAAAAVATQEKMLATVICIVAGFFSGAALGAAAFATSGLRASSVALCIVGCVTLWAAMRETGALEGASWRWLRPPSAGEAPTGNGGSSAALKPLHAASNRSSNEHAAV